MAKRIAIPTPAQVRKLRESLHLTQAQAAEKVGVGQSTWSDWEKGRRRPSRQSAILLQMLKNL